MGFGKSSKKPSRGIQKISKHRSKATNIIRNAQRAELDNLSLRAMQIEEDIERMRAHLKTQKDTARDVDLSTDKRPIITKEMSSQTRKELREEFKNILREKSTAFGRGKKLIRLITRQEKEYENLVKKIEDKHAEMARTYLRRVGQSPRVVADRLRRINGRPKGRR